MSLLPAASRGGWRSSPDIVEEGEPIAAHHALDALVRPAAARHRGGQVGKLADRADPLRVQNLAELGQLAAVPLVVGDVVEEELAVPLREVGPDADILLADTPDHVSDRVEVVLDRRGGPPRQEGREHRYADEAAVLGDEAELRVGL